VCRAADVGSGTEGTSTPDETAGTPEDIRRATLLVLITNYQLCGRSGSELYVSDLARELLARGHRPVVYSPVLGPLARELRDATIPVIDDLSLMTAAPDIVHGHHNHELLTALLRFPAVPAVRVCHGWSDERPHLFPRIFRVVCVDQTVRDRAVCEWGVPESQIVVVHNFVDLARFAERPPLPARPRRALVFSNAAARHLAVVRRACAVQDIILDAAGQSVGAAAGRPEELLGRYDLIFAKGRSALEALATGAAVILCDEAGVGPLVLESNVERLRDLNFGIRTLANPLSVESITPELAKYDPADAARVCASIRRTAGIDRAVTVLLAVYEEVIDQFQRGGRADPALEFRAASEYLQRRGSALTTDSTLRHQLFGVMRHLYYRCERVAMLRPFLPSRRRARALGAALRDVDDR
jgi:hypothetical protein